MNWKTYDIIDGIEYRLHLCQAMGGLRIFKLIQDESEANKNRAPEVFFATEIVPNSLLKSLNIEAISESIKLENGQPFFIDAHRMWLTEAEINQMDKKVPISEIKWSTGSPPKFAPM